MLVSIWRKRNPRALLVEIKLVQRLWKAVWSFLSKLKLGLWFDPAILLWSVRPKETKTLTQKDTCIPMFIAVFFFTVAKTWAWKQPKCPTMDEWTRKM